MKKRRPRPRPIAPPARPPSPGFGLGLAMTPLAADALPACPFCGAAVFADVASGAVIHGLPMCDRFRQLSPDRFLEAMRIELEGN